ncbi:MAG: heparinase II/III family protein [Lentisphaeria bacterium]|nr:heparinase II/III family protein [Lentisphaeria bacterium]
MKKLLCLLSAAVSVMRVAVSAGEGVPGNREIFRANCDGDGYFDSFLPPDFYKNFAEGKFNRDIYPRFSDRTAWENARKSPYCDMILREADKIGEGDVPQLLFSEYRKFAENGDRAGYQKPYFKRRANIACLSLAMCLTGDKTKYMSRLLDNIVAVMEETTWTLPAHAKWDKTRLLAPKPSDLFCCETGALLALVHHLLGEELDREYENLSEQIRMKVLERTVYNILFDPDSGKMHGWYTKERPNNWTPWCAYNTLICIFLLEKDTGRLAQYVREFMRVIARFAAHYPDDGYCEEGPAYYEKAGLLMFGAMQLMQKAQPGSMDKLFAEPKIRAMLEFIGHMRMNSDQMLSFADSQPEFPAALHLIIPCAQLLNSATLLTFCSGKTATLGNSSDSLHAGLGLLFDCSGLPEPGRERHESFICFENHLAISRRKEFTVAVKVGNNAESHNHNDLGNFVLYHKDRPVVIDAGSAEYSRINFSSQRYTLWYTRGSGHNAPVFGDVEQLAGRNYTASFLQADPEKIAVDLSKAYPESAGVRSFRRSLDIGEEKITVSDDFSLETPLPATVTLLTPSSVQILDENHLKIGNTTLETRNISFDSMEKMPLLEGTQLGFPDGIWRCNLTALRFKSESAKYEFIFKADHPAAP